MKTAVYQVNERGGRTRLVCVRMPSLRAAANLESWLKMNAEPATEVRFIGRFDFVHMASGEQEAETLILKAGNPPSDLKIAV